MFHHVLLLSAIINLPVLTSLPSLHLITLIFSVEVTEAVAYNKFSLWSLVVLHIYIVFSVIRSKL